MKITIEYSGSTVEIETDADTIYEIVDYAIAPALQGMTFGVAQIASAFDEWAWTHSPNEEYDEP